MASNYHSRVLRESLRDGSHSVASSTGSQHGTVSPDSTFSAVSFNPDQDDPYSESTRVFGEPSLPKLRDTAKKYPWTRDRSPELVIDTSALKRSFPNFSQFISPRDRIDMEKIARLAAQGRNAEPTSSRAPKSDIANTPLTKEQSHRDPIPHNKENHNPASYVSGATRTRDGAIRRTLAELHPKVRDGSDFSVVSDRPEKSSRFSSNEHTQQSQNTTTKTQGAKQQISTKSSRITSQKTSSSKPSMSQKTPINKSQPLKMQDNLTIASSILRNPTQQSFLLPKDGPEISELVTATFKDGSPVYVQSGAVQSRFANTGRPLPRKHVAVDGIELPQDEQDIFLNLQMMQERVTQLEREKSDVQRIANDLDKENYKLREDLKDAIAAARRRSDSAISDTGAADAAKSRLQEEVNTLKLEAETSKRKIQTLELHLTNNTTERDHAIKRVAEFNNTCENLKSENIGLKNEVDALRQQGEHVANQREASHRELKQNESSWRNRQAELEHKISDLEDKVLRYDQYIADLRESYGELQQSASSAKDEVASLKELLQTSKLFNPNSQNKDERNEDELKMKIYRLEKALRRVLSLKYEKDLVTEKLGNTASAKTPTAPAAQHPAMPNSVRSRVGSTYQDSAFFAKANTALNEEMLKMNVNATTTSDLSAKQDRTTQKTGRDMVVQMSKPTSQKPISPLKTVEVTANKLPFNPVVIEKVPNAVGPKSALTNAAIKAYGFGDFPWTYAHDDDATRSSNFDSIVGPGVMQELRDDVVNVRAAPVTNPAEDGDDTFNFTKNKTSRTLRKSNAEQEEDQRDHVVEEFDSRAQKNQSRQSNRTEKLQKPSNVAERPFGGAHQRRHSEGLTIRDLNETVMTSVSRRSAAMRNRSRSQTSMYSRISRASQGDHHRDNSDNMTSAYIIPDIEVAASATSKQSRPRHPSNIPVCGHGFPYHGPEQCDECARTASSIIDGLDSNKETTQLIPVSERMPAAVDGQDEPTLRPSMPPMDALTRVLKALTEEERDMRKTLSGLQYDLNSLDSSLERSKRKALAARVDELQAATQKKADQIYFLYDVLEGLKDTEEWEGIED